MECPTCHSQLIPDAAYCPKCGARQDGVPECDTFDYAAFVSYRHREPDAGVAERLHAAIEAYRLPAAVAAAYGAPKLGRVFRDRDELPATGSLPAAIREALRHSRALVVVCSPATPGSRWVEQEIEAFASYHGRERIFAVLAEGSSSESMPESLRTRMEPDAGGVPRSVPAEPLAADLRGPSRRQFAREKLRVVAAIAGCSFDDLAQRERTRRRKQAAVAAVVTLAIALALAFLGTQALQQRETALLEESQRLTAQSQQLFAQGNRYEAIETALAALPASESDTSRPLVPEAQEALEQALEINPGSSPWRSSYSLATENAMGLIGHTSLLVATDADPTSARASAIVTCDDPGYIAISDDAGAINTYDLFTGAHLATCTMPSSDKPLDNEVYSHLMQAIGKRLVVSSPSSDTIACFDALTGDLLWSYDNLACATMAASHDGSRMDVATFQPEGTFDAGCINVETGEVVAATNPSDTPLPKLGDGVFSAMGPRVGDFCFAIGNTLVLVDLGTGEHRTAPLAFDEAASIAWYDDTIIACTVSEYDGDELELTYAVEAFDANLEKKWSFERKLASEMFESEGFSTLVMGWPVLQGCVFKDATAAIVSAGRNVYALDLATGDVVYEHGFASSVLAAFPWEADTDVFRLTIACADGTIVEENPESPTRNYTGDLYRKQLGEPIRWSQVVPSSGMFHWVSASASADNRLVAYWTDFTTSDEPKREYSLDELIAIAHEQLEQAGR